MIIGTLNIRGGGNISKRKRINNIISTGKAEIFFIQESKLRVLKSSIMKSFWRNPDMGWSSNNAMG